MKDELPFADDMINDIHAYMDDALEMLQKGEYVELLGLTDRVKNLCSQVVKLPVEEAMDYKDDLTALIERLDNLKTYMEAHKEVLGEQIGGLESSKVAARAYQKSHYLPGPQLVKNEDDD